MVKKLVLIMIMAVMLSCSVSSKISDRYIGKGVEVLYKEFGNPKSISEKPNGNRLLEYEKDSYIRQTEIGTGRGTLDKRVSPGYTKVETYWFEVNKEGVIVHTEYNKRIEK